MKRIFSLFLALTLILSIVGTPVSAATVMTGTNGNTIYLSTKAVAADEDEGLPTTTEISSVAEGGDFFIQVDFSNNPTELADSAQSYAIILQYDNSKMTAEDVVNGLTSPTANTSFTTNTVLATWASETGIKLGTKIKANGTLYYIYFTAKTALTADDLASFVVVKEADSTHSFIADQAEKEFTLVQTPALTVTPANDAKFFTSFGAADVKAALTSITSIAKDGTATTVEKDAAGWSDLTVTLPNSATALVKGDNVCTATYGDVSCEFTVTAEAPAVSALEITTAPTLSYTSGDKLDLSAMVVKATYNDGKTVDNSYKAFTVAITGGDAVTSGTTVMKTAHNGKTLTVTDTSVNENAASAVTGALTVTKKTVTAPTATGTYTFDNTEKTFTVGTNTDAAYYTITGTSTTDQVTKGTNAGDYTATAALNDTTETEWVGGDTTDKTLTWTIGRAAAQSLSDKAVSQKYTVTTQQTVSVADVMTGNPGTLSYAKGTEDTTGTVTVSSWDVDATTGVVSYTLSGGAENDTVTLPVVISSANYEASTVNVVITLVDKDVVTLSGASVANKTYDGSAAQVTYPVGKINEETKLDAGSENWTVTYYKSTGDSTWSEALGSEPVNAGTYKAKFDVAAENPDYKSTTPMEVTFTIAPKSIEGATVTLSDSALDYTGSDLTVSVSKVELGSKELTKTTEYIVDADDSTLTARDVCEYTVTVSGTGNYTGTATAKWNINKATALVSTNPTAKTLTYTGTAQELVDEGATSDGTMEYRLGTTGDFDTEIPTATNAGKYTVYYKVAGDDNHNDSTPASVEVTIDAKDISAGVTVADIIGQTFDGNAKTPALTVKFGEINMIEGTDYDVTFTDNTNAGTDTAKATLTGTGNYTGTLEKTFSIAKAAAPDVQNVALNVYFGNTEAVTVTYTGIPENAGNVTKTYNSDKSGADILNGAPTATSFTLADGLNENDVNKSASWTVTISSDNYEDKTVTVTVTLVNVTFKVGDDAATDANAITVDSTKLTYGSKWSDIVSKATNFTATVNGQNDTTQDHFKLYVGDVEMTGTTVPAVGSYTVKVMYSGSIGGKDYNDVKVAQTTVVITEADLTGVSVSQSGALTYTGSAQTASVNKAAAAKGEQTVTFTYSTTQSGYGDMPTFTDADVYTVYYKASAANHKDATGSFTVTIGKATLTGVSVSQTGMLTYTGDDLTATVDAAATAKGDRTVTFTYCATQNGTYEAAVPAFSAAGTHTVYYKATAANHNDATGSFTVTIGKAASNLTTAPTANTLTYTGAAQALVNAGAATGGTVQYSLSQNSGYSANVPTGTNAGTYTVYYKVVGDSNHSDTTPASVSVTIAKADRNLNAWFEVNSTTRTELYKGETAELKYDYADEDSSATVIYAVTNISGDPTTVISGFEEYTANGTGVLTVTVNINATDNYNAATEQTLTLTVYCQPTLTLTVADSGNANANLQAVAKNDTLILSGNTTALDLTKLSYADKAGYTMTPSTDGKTLTVMRDGHTVGTYTVDATAVVVTPITVTIEEEPNDVTPATGENAEAANAAMNGTKVEGIAAAAVQDAIAQAGDSAAAVTVKVTVAISEGVVAKDDSGNIASIAMDITPTATVTVDGGTPTTTEIKELPVPVKMIVPIPEGFTPNMVEHQTGTNPDTFEYIAVTIETVGGQSYAVWYQSSFSPIKLLEDNTMAGFNFGNGYKVYDVSWLGKELPVPSGTGTFNGWTFTDSDGVKQTTKVMTYELLQAMYNGESPEPNFTNEQEDHPFFPGLFDEDLIEITRVAHGKVIASTLNPRAGKTVTLTAKPDVGYQTAYIKATVNGKALMLTRVSENVYTFVMPRKSPVIVTASFVKASMDQGFTDVALNSFCYDAVQWAVAEGVTNGLTANTFGPKNSCTRAQVVTFLWRAAGCPKPTSKVNPFTDVKAGAYYYDAVLWAVERGITKGLTATTFGTNNTVTRAQFVTFLYRAEKGYISYISNSFTDVDTGAYYYPAVQWAVANGITTGLTATTFAPNATCNRGQVVTFLYRCFAK